MRLRNGSVSPKRQDQLIICHHFFSKLVKTEDKFAQITQNLLRIIHLKCI